MTDKKPSSERGGRQVTSGTIALFVVLSILSTASIVYWIWGAATGNRETVSVTHAPLTLPIDTTYNWTPLAPLEEGPLQTPFINEDGEIIPAIGMYLPRTGYSQFELVTPTPRPTVFRNYPTSPPFAVTVAALAETFSPPTPTGPTAVAYGGDDCAPAGLPVGGILTQYFHRWHSGIDLGVSIGTPVLATHSGVVTFAGWSRIGYGNLIIMQNGRFITYYAHLNSFNVTSGQEAGKGSIIGWSGNTGNSTGPHVHYEVRLNDIPQNPLSFESNGYPSC